MPDRDGKERGHGEGGVAPDNVEPLRPPRPCPICGKPSVRKYHPFCSKHCADIDLHRWLSGSYAIPVVEEDGSVPDGGENGDG